jgi:hypothetical protein
VALALLSGARAWSLPSFATQTGMPCGQCHPVSFGPALTSYGRQFKLNGYVWGDADRVFPLVLMMQGGYTHTHRSQPEAPALHYSSNDNVSLDQASLFYAGRISSRLGAFVQVTYSGPDRKTRWDNLDVRYARGLSFGSTGVVLGVSVNNNPTIQDLWNSTPGWGFPYISSAVAPKPAAAPLITGLGQAVFGATVYAMLNDRIYVEAGSYRGVSHRWLGNLGLDASARPDLDGIAPYWRAALQFSNGNHYWSIGTFGLAASLLPDPAQPGSDRYTDTGFDATYQFTAGDRHAIAANLSLTHERRALNASFAQGASDSASNHLTAISSDLTYAFDQTWVVSLAGFDLHGSVNNGLYAPTALSGSNNGAPDSRGYTLQAEYIPFGKLNSRGGPWLNVRLGAQFTGYLKFNGGTSNYDGFGRAAKDNNPLFIYVWLIG